MSNNCSIGSWRDPHLEFGRNIRSWFEKLLVEGFLLLFQGMIFGWFLPRPTCGVVDLDRLLITGRPLPKGSSSGSGGYSGGAVTEEEASPGAAEVSAVEGLRELVGTPSSLIRRRSYLFLENQEDLVGRISETSRLGCRPASAAISSKRALEILRIRRSRGDFPSLNSMRITSPFGLKPERWVSQATG